MRRLLWKEWHERWIWLLLWTLAVVITAVLGIGQQGFGTDSVQFSWFPLPVMLALLAGLGAYGSELKGERATFLYSRAQLWKQLFLAKVLLGLAVAFLAPALGAIAFRLAAPAVFHPFMTPAALAQGALEMAWNSGVAYLLGLGCSIVLPGLAGGILTLLLWGGIFATLLGDSLYERNLDFVFFFTIVLSFVGPFIASIVLARFGLTLRGPVRLLRFVLIALAFSVCGFLLDNIPPIQHQLYAWQMPKGYWSVTISPSGAYAYGVQYSMKLTQHHWAYYWLRLADGSRSALLPDENYPLNVRWITSDCLSMAVPSVLYAQTYHNHIIFWWDKDHLRSCNLFLNDDSKAIISPDSKLVLLTSSDNLQLFSLQTGKATIIARLDTRLTRSKDTLEREKATANALDPSDPYAQSWWQTDHQVGYLDPMTGKRVLVDVE